MKNKFNEMRQKWNKIWITNRWKKIYYIW